MIEGVSFRPLKVFPDERGSVMHMLKRTDDHFEEFGEIYFSTIRAEVVKAWHIHKKMTLNYACVFGQIIVGLIDLRAESLTFNQQEIYLMDAVQDYHLLTIPPQVWNGFRIPINSEFDQAILANCATLPHDPDEIERVHPNDFPVPFDWGSFEVAG
jgi:dTDP-4-dehydrorhamnose 3,5-epimerase